MMAITIFIRIAAWTRRSSANGSGTGAVERSQTTLFGRLRFVGRVVLKAGWAQLQRALTLPIFADRLRCDLHERGFHVGFIGELFRRRDVRHRALMVEHIVLDDVE
jgi:hypothetical protein